MLTPLIVNDPPSGSMVTSSGDAEKRLTPLKSLEVVFWTYWLSCWNSRL